MKTKRLTKRKSKKLSFTTIAIIGEGFCEYNYFQSMKEFEKEQIEHNKITFLPDKPDRTGRKCTEILDDAIDFIDNYDYNYVFCILDNDTILSCKKNQENYLNKLDEVRKFCKKYKFKHSVKITLLEFPENLSVYNIKNAKKAIIVLKNMPCLEFWFLLHFIKISKLFNNCDHVKNLLKKYLKSYSKKQDYYERNNLYLKLREKLHKAVENAEKINDLRKKNPDCHYSYSDLFYLIKFLNLI